MCLSVTNNVHKVNNGYNILPNITSRQAIWSKTCSYIFSFFNSLSLLAETKIQSKTILTCITVNKRIICASNHVIFY